MGRHCAKTIIPLCLAFASFGGVHSFTPPLHSKTITPSVTKHYTVTVDDPTTTTTATQEPPTRLQKAQKILQELQKDPNTLLETELTDKTLPYRPAQREDPTLTSTAITSTFARWSANANVAEPLIKYDPVATEKLLFRQPNRWLVRNVQIALPLGFWALRVAADLLTGKELTHRRERADQLLRTLTGLGPAIIKGGQALASRPDLMPGEYLEALQKLQDDVPTYDNDVAVKIVEEELGVTFEDVFELVQSEPVAAASIGQVYKARLLRNGETVALKIQRPNCEEVIALDLYILRWWSGVYNRIFELLGRDIDVQGIIDDFGVLIYRELDYVAEAANAQRFAELYGGTLKDVFVPKIYSELTTSKVLTMEWVDGFRLTDGQTLDAYNLDRKKLLDTLIQCSLRQILENGFFHADPHAGNLLATPDGRLCYLDFGMMSYAATRQRNGFLLAVVHIVNRDWAELVKLYQRLGFIPENTDLEPIEVALEGAMPNVLNADVSELNFKNVISELGDIMYTYPFSLPPFYTSIIRCLGVLEGLAIQVDPQTRVISEAYPYVASRVLTDSQDDLQEALRRLALTPDGLIRWERLEGLLDKAKGSSGYDVTAALEQLTNYMISDDGLPLLKELADQLVEASDSLGIESLAYLTQASTAMSINDEVQLVRAVKALQSLIRDRDLKEVSKGLPPPSASMRQFLRIVELLNANGGGDVNGGSRGEWTKFLPLLRKLSQEPRVQQTAGDVVARLGERMLSRGLRAAFGLPQPSFNGRGGGMPVE